LAPRQSRQILFCVQSSLCELYCKAGRRELQRDAKPVAERLYAHDTSFAPNRRICQVDFEHEAVPRALCPISLEKDARRTDVSGDADTSLSIADR
jgi:hypothetical protein